MPYAANYLATYPEMHRGRSFSGNLAGLVVAPAEHKKNGRGRSSDFPIDEILDVLVLPNGVRKTTSAGRQLDTLRTFLRQPERPPDGSCLRVLDLPCSSGVASVDAYDLLASHYRIDSYVLADICLEVQFDRRRNAVYATSGELLQVGGGKYFFSMYRPHASGLAYTFLSALILWPLSLRARFLRRKFAIAKSDKLEAIRLLDPEAERRIAQGKFTARSADVFALPWVGEFDLVLSFNLLQRNYFPPGRIAQGMQNLGRALVEGGSLIIGNTESFSVLRKVSGTLKPQYSQGEW